MVPGFRRVRKMLDINNTFAKKLGAVRLDN